MLVLSHRGWHQGVPENTLEAFAEAVARGVDGIETDLRLTADGELVLFHDALAPDGRAVAELARDELCRQLGFEVPRAADALERWGDLLWNLEIKTPAALEATLELVERYGTSRRLIVTSFWHDVVEQVASRANVECGLLVVHRPSLDPAGAFGLRGTVGSAPAAVAAEPATSGRGKITTIVWYYETLDEVVLEAAREAGFRNWVFGAEGQPAHRRCHELKLDAVITDRPDLARLAASETVK